MCVRRHTHSHLAATVGLETVAVLSEPYNSDIVRDVTDWIADDGLHPTEAGYREMSRVWLNNIQGAFAASAAGFRVRAMYERRTAFIRVW